MKPIKLKDVSNFVEQNIGTFHETRLQRIKDLKLKKLLKRKNPYLFKAKNILTAQDLITSILDAYLSSQEETIFGEFLENLAIYVSHKTTGGRKSSAEGIDLEFNNDGITYIVAIKSGPNWGNSQGIRRLRDNFKQAKRILRSNNRKLQVEAVNGCCYGQDRHPDKGDYLKLCGQDFWEFISDNDHLYLEIIEPLGKKAKQRNEEFDIEYAMIVNRFTKEFMDEYCTDGAIIWERLVEFNSGKNK